MSRHRQQYTRVGASCPHYRTPAYFDKSVASPGRIHLGLPSKLTNLTRMSIVTWYSYRAMATDTGMINKQVQSGVWPGWYITYLTAGGRLRMNRNYTVTGATITADFPIVPNAPLFSAGVLDTFGGSTTNQFLMWGTPTRAPQEPSSYVANSLPGSATPEDDSTGYACIGGVYPTVNWDGMNGTVYWVGVWNRMLTRAEVLAIYENPDPALWASGSVLWLYPTPWGAKDFSPNPVVATAVNSPKLERYSSEAARILNGPQRTLHFPPTFRRVLPGRGR